MIVSLDHAKSAGYPILKPGIHAWWQPAATTLWVPVTVLGYGEYTSAFGKIVEGVTVRVNAEREGAVHRGELFPVCEDNVSPRELRKWHRQGKYYYPHGSWAFDHRCPAHGVVHSLPSSVCKQP